MEPCRPPRKGVRCVCLNSLHYLPSLPPRTAFIVCDPLLVRNLPHLSFPSLHPSVHAVKSALITSIRKFYPITPIHHTHPSHPSIAPIHHTHPSHPSMSKALPKQTPPFEASTIRPLNTAKHINSAVSYSIHIPIYYTCVSTAPKRKRTTHSILSSPTHPPAQKSTTRNPSQHLHIPHSSHKQTKSKMK